ncbi:hypothetical protein [Flavobacterium sp.]|uniref:hypothetical protein n=1 Tax=Flavobacterium sp. TaxID=239 RepID=UPI002BBDC90F|nr:hypothetical protein [Flavobacterium sp.]HSD06488.1 hypothetical protein [Flavobacterium sp.]
MGIAKILFMSVLCQSEIDKEVYKAIGSFQNKAQVKLRLTYKKNGAKGFIKLIIPSKKSID